MAIHYPTTPAQYVIILVDLAGQRGVDARELLEGTHLSLQDLARVGGRVADEEFAVAIDNAYRLTGDPALGLHLGLRLNLSSHATLGQAFMTCENLEQVMNFFLKYYHILAPSLDISYDQAEGRCWMTPTPSQQIQTAEFTYELFFGAVVQTVQMLLNREELAFRVEFPYAEPEYVEEYYEVFGEELYFNCPRGRLSFDEVWLDAPLPSSNPALLALYEQECQRLLADLEEKDSLAERTLQLLRKLEGHYPQMPRVAEMLNLSPRTYRRRLAEEEVSFQQLLDQVRTEHATHYLRSTRLPLASIAYMVGFNDVSNFRRAYIKWTGQTPREARAGG